jgi:phage tail protein X
LELRVQGFDVYTTLDGDTVDLIAYRRFGRHGAETAIFEANPMLAALEAEAGALPAGMRIWIPLPEEKDRQVLQNVWGSTR